ncbi:hypothetical protein BKA64DRAFT_681130 [Cadophora sp. MPI-SDFR-AT-0126]|nr:hypothetical protein BKA64DRAFT_681130 [Leotiomycetes sp. MPI-SDFR-AT-0126]
MTHNHEKRTLSFSGCIRTKLREVSVFEVCFSSPQRSIIVNEIISGSTAATISLFGDQMTWDLESLFCDIFNFLNILEESRTSRVGPVSFPKSLNIIATWVVDQFPHFPKVIYATSRTYTRSDNSLLTAPNHSELVLVAGNQLLTYLDEKLKPTCLARSTVDQLRILFLGVFGMILAVGILWREEYCEILEAFPTIRSMQSHLCQILAHFLVYLGSQLGLPIKLRPDQFVLDIEQFRLYKH